MPDDDGVYYYEASEPLFADQDLNDFITSAIINNGRQTGWDVPHSDPLTDIYNAMQMVNPDKLILRSANKDDAYVITTLQPRSPDANRTQEG